MNTKKKMGFAKFEILGEVATVPVEKTTAKGKQFMSFYVRYDALSFDESAVIPNYYELLVWNDKAMERCKELVKGDPIYVEGPLKSSPYTNRAGERKTSISLFLGTFSSEHSEEVEAAINMARDPLSIPAENTVSIDSSDLPF